MGRLAIILVLALSFTAGIIGYSINIAKTRTVENVTGFQKYTTARNIAHTGVNMMLRTLDKNDTSFTNPLQAGKKVWLVKNFMAGLCSVSIKLTNPAFLDTVDMTSKAVFMDTTKSMALRLRRQPVPFPVINEAVGLRVPNVDFQMRGNPNINGNNHDINGNLLPPSADDKPAVGVLTASPDSGVVAPYGSKLEGTQDVKVDTGMSNPALFVNDYIDAADRVYTPGTYAGNYVWGSQAAPEIVFCNGDPSKVKFTGTVDGWGILVIKGSIEVSGNFKFRGLVIGYNDVEIGKDTLAFTLGTPDIIGGVLMAGNTGSRFEMRGNDKIVYSKEALELAKYINKLQVYRVMKWYE